MSRAKRAAKSDSSPEAPEGYVEGWHDRKVAIRRVVATIQHPRPRCGTLAGVLYDAEIDALVAHHAISISDLIGAALDAAEGKP